MPGKRADPVCSGKGCWIVRLLAITDDPDINDHSFGITAKSHAESAISIRARHIAERDHRLRRKGDQQGNKPKCAQGANDAVHRH